MEDLELVLCRLVCEYGGFFVCVVYELCIGSYGKCV